MQNEPTPTNISQLLKKVWFETPLPKRFKYGVGMGIAGLITTYVKVKSDNKNVPPTVLVTPTVGWALFGTLGPTAALSSFVTLRLIDGLNFGTLRYMEWKSKTIKDANQ